MFRFLVTPKLHLTPTTRPHYTAALPHTNNTDKRMENAPLLTPAEVASRLNTTLRDVYDKLAHGGPLHHLRIDLGHRTVRVDAAALEEFLQSRRPTAHADS